MPVASDPRIQRVRRSESFCGTSSAQEGPSFFASPATPGPNRLGFKRAPSFGAIAQEAKARGQHYTYGSSAEDLSFTFEPSSDEEEKLRNKLAKKPRTKSGAVAVSAQKPPSTKLGPTTRSKSAVSADTKTSTPSTKVAETPVRRPVRRMPLQRQPHIFQPELPHLHIPSSDSQEQILATPLASPTTSSRPLPDPPAVVPAGQVRTLRRVRRLRPSRRISFGSLAPSVSGDDADADGEGEEFELGSAFQLH